MKTIYRNLEHVLIILSALALMLGVHADAAPVPPPGVQQHGSVTASHVATWTGNLTIQDGGALPTPTAPGGSSGQVQYNNAGAFGGLTNAQLTADCNVFTSSLSGCVPFSGGGTTNFLRADGTWTTPGGGGTVTTTGSPASGNLAQFSGASSITNGNLSGDVTTSGTLAATVTKINGVALGTTTATSGNILVADGTAWDTQALSGDCTLASAGAITCTKTNGAAFATIATSGSASDLTAGTLPAGRFPALTGDVTTSAGALATTLATVNASPGTYTNATVTVNNKGLVTSASSGSTYIAKVKRTVITSTGTYTADAHLVYAQLHCIGGGGGGGGVSTTTGEGGGGGAAGSEADLIASAATIGASQSVTIGAGGTGGASTPGNGGTGGTTSIGALLSCPGGLGGVAGANNTSSPGGAGQTATGGDWNGTGAPGGSSTFNGASAMECISGNGGSTSHGGGGVGIEGVGSNGNNGVANTGGGGGGANENSLGTGKTGGVGGSGEVIITEYTSQ